jgi:peptidyl-prolyl cis-trans isomerase SurA
LPFLPFYGKVINEKPQTFDLKMKKKLFLVCLSAVCSVHVWAQDVDPVIMTIGNKPISRSEFEYIYNKNQNASSSQKLSLDDYVQLFVNFKLKVAEAESLGLDTTSSFRTEFLGYRQQVASAYLTDEAADEAYVQAQYDSLMDEGEWTCVRLAHIFKYVPQNATEAQRSQAEHTIDSIYACLQRGEKFADLARICSDDRQSATNGGMIGWVQRHRAIPKFEEVAFALPVGTYSEPFTTVNGFHIVMKYAQDTATVDNVRNAILALRAKKGLLPVGKIVKARELREKYSLEGMDDAEVLEWADQNLEKIEPAFAHLMQEYRDGILLFEISKQTVWDKAGEDTTGLVSYFEANRANYAWDEPRFKGAAMHTRDKATRKKLKKLLKKNDFSQWSELIRTQFNTNDSIAVRAQIGVFTKGLNKFVDEECYKGDKAEPLKDFPYTLVMGEKLKAPEAYTDVKGQVTSDYQAFLEKEWIAGLQKKYPVVIDREVLKTVNNH